MRKSIRRPVSSTKSPRKRVLQLSRETVRALTPEELLHAVGGVVCPTGSSVDTRSANSSAC